MSFEREVDSGDIENGTIVDADISPAAGIALSKLATDPLARANHTGTQAPATISPQGTGSGLNADLVDSLHATAFRRSNVWEPIFHAGGVLFDGWGADTYPLGVTNQLPFVASNNNDTHTFFWVPSAYAIPGLTTRWRLLGTAAQNAVDPLIDFVFDIVPVTAGAGGPGVIDYTEGVAIATTPAVNTAGNFDGNYSAEVNAPAQGLYIIRVNTDLVMPTDSAVRVDGLLEISYV